MKAREESRCEYCGGRDIPFSWWQREVNGLVSRLRLCDPCGRDLARWTWLDLEKGERVGRFEEVAG